MDKFKIGDRVVLNQEHWSGKPGEQGEVVRTDGDDIPKVRFDNGVKAYVFGHQLDPATPPQRDDRRERIATAMLAGFAADSSTGAMSGADLAREAVELADALIEELDR